MDARALAACMTDGQVTGSERRLARAILATPRDLDHELRQAREMVEWDGKCLAQAELDGNEGRAWFYRDMLEHSRRALAAVETAIFRGDNQ